VALAVAGALLLSTLDAMDSMRAAPEEGFDFGAALGRLVRPAAIGGWVTILGLLSFAAVGGVFIAAMRARRGVRP
jgi:hypothetical protein